MQATVTTYFIDKETDAPRNAGDVLTVTAERGAQLAHAGVVGSLTFADAQEELTFKDALALLDKELMFRTGVYVHPATHPATMIEEDTANQFVTASQKTKLDGLNKVISGTEVFSGDGIKTVFAFNHGLGATPTCVVTEARSADAAGARFVSNKTATGFEVTYLTAPPTGTNNGMLDFQLM